jgi:hypothetical protein
MDCRTIRNKDIIWSRHSGHRSERTELARQHLNIACESIISCLQTKQGSAL